MLLLWAQVRRRPVDSVAVLAVAAGCLAIMVNALFLQSRSLPAPVPLAAWPRPPVRQSPPDSIKVSAPAAPAHAAATRKGAHAAATGHDAIGKLIDQSRQIVAVQRALADYGYGQLRPSGILDRPTREAITRFERDRNIPATGKISDRLVVELAVLIGHPLQ